MANRSKSKRKSINSADKTDKRFKRGLIYAILGFILLAALWLYLNRDEPLGGTVITLVVAAAGAALGLWLVYRLNYKK
jgi:polyferredoxin